MLSKNNYKERLRKMEPKKDRFSIRKFSIGAASVLIGSVFIGMSNGETVEAQDVNPDNGNDGKPVDKTDVKTTEIPNKVVVTTTLDPKDFNDNATLTQKNTEASKTENHHKDEVNTKNTNQVSEAQDSVQKSTTETTNNQNPTSVKNEQSKAETDKQLQKSDSQNSQQSKVTKQSANASTVQDSNANIVANKVTKDVNNAAQATLNNAPAQTENKDSNTAKNTLPTDITAKSTASTTENLKDYQAYMDNLEKKLPSMSKEDQTAALNDAKKKFDSLSKAQQLALSNQVLSTADQSVTVSSFEDFTAALINKNVNQINFDSDITAADNQSALVSGGTGFGANGLQPYELAANKISIWSPYKGIAHNVVINGNNHTLDMNKWFISLWGQNYSDDNGWNITFKDMNLKTNISDNRWAPIHFQESGIGPQNITKDQQSRSSLTYDNVNVDLQGNGPLSDAPVKTTFKGKSTINVTGGTTAAVIDGTSTTADNSNINIEGNLTINDKAGRDHVIDTAENIVIGKNGSLTINEGDSSSAILNAANVNVNGKLSIDTQADVTTAIKVGNLFSTGEGANVEIFGGDTGIDADAAILINDNGNINIRSLGQNMIAPTVTIGNGNTINLVDLYNSSMQNFDNNGITASKGITIGNGNAINFNTGDAISGIEDFNTLNRTDVRGIFASSDTMDVAAKLAIGQNNKINMDMAKGHSSAITADDINIGENTDINIHTMQDNNHVTHMNVAQSWEDPTKWLQIIHQMSLFAKNPDFFHRAPITVAFNSNGTLHLAKGASLKVVRDNHDENIITPMISFGSGGDGRKGVTNPFDFLAGAPRDYSLIVDGGASLDLQDASSSKGLWGFNWKYSSYLDNDYEDMIHHAAMISMFGTNSNDVVQFGTEKDSKYIAPKYINLQRTGTQFGTMLNLEGKALPGKWSIDITKWWKNIQNVALMYGRAPLAQWDKSNNTDTPNNAWNIEEVVSQNGGGNTSYNYVPADTSQLSTDGFVKNKAIQGISFGNSNGIAILPVKDENGKLELTQYNGNQNNKGEITGNKSNLVQLQNFLNNFNWWKARRICYGTDLADKKTASDHSIHINENDQYDPIVAPQTYTEGKKLTIGDFSKNKIVIGVTDANYKQIKDNLDKIVTSANWGIDWTHTSLKDCLDSDGNIDPAKINALKSTTGKSDNQIYQDVVLYNSYESFIKSINNPDGTTGYDPAKFNSGLKLSDSTKESQTYNIPITVTYADGNADVAIVPVTVLKKKQNTEYQPKYQTTTVKQGDTATVAAPTFMSQIPNLDGGYDYKSLSSSPKDVTFSLTKDTVAPDFITLNSDGSIALKPTTANNIGIYTIPVTVTYSDKSTDNISALVNVTDGKSQVIWGNTNADGTVSGAVIVKPSDAMEAHKTTDKSMSFDSSDAKKAVGEVDVYTQDSKDKSKLSAPVQYTYDANTDNFINGTTKLGANISYETLPDTTQPSTSGKVTVKFGMDSAPVKDGAIDNGVKATITQDVKLVGATVANPLTPITIPKNDYASGAIAKFLPSDKVATLINHQALDAYGKDHINNAVTSYEVVDSDGINTYKTGIRDVTVRVNFKDGTYLDLPVKAGVKVADGEDAKYQPTYNIVVSADQKDIISALPTWDKNGKPADGITYTVINGTATINNDGIVTIPASSLTDTADKDITVQVTYKDGTKDYVHFLAYEIKGVGNVTDPYSAKDAIHNAYDLPMDTKFEWHTVPNTHISTPQNLSVDVTISGKTVNVPVTVTLTKTQPDNTTKVYSDDTSASIIVATPDYHKTTGSNTPVAPKVSEIDLFDETGKQVKKYTLSNDGAQYIDGSGNTISADAFSTKWDDDHTLDTDSSKFSQDGTATTSSTSDDEKDKNENSKYRVILHWNSDAASVIGIPAPSADSDINWANVYANIYGAKAAKANKENNNLEATHNVTSTLKDATNYVDSSDLTKEHNSEVDKITWKTAPDITKLGKQTGTAEISFKDGTILDIPVSITVNKSQADNFNDKNTDKNPLTHELSYGKGATIPATDALKGIGTKDETPASLGITDATFKETVLTDQDHVGKDTDYDATVTFDDGSTAIVKIPVMITDQATTNAPVAKDKPVQVDQGSTVDPNSIIDTDKSTLPKNTTEKWTTKPDTSKSGTQKVTISLTYPDGTTGTLNGKVTVEATPVTQTIQLKQGIPAVDGDAAGGVTNLDTKGADGMPKSVVWTTVPSTDKAGIQDATIDITYNDGYQKKNVPVKVNVWSTKKGTDEKGKDPTDPDYKNMVKTITRTITVDGKNTVQTVTFTRDKYTDSTNKDNVTYGIWTTDNPTFEETGKVSKDGYTATVTGNDQKGNDYKLTNKGTIAAETIRPPKAPNTDWNPVNETITVTNKANEETVNISYIDKKSGKEITVTPTQSFTGNTDDKVSIIQADDSKSFTIGDKDFTIPEGYKIDKDGLVSSYTIPAQNGKLLVTLDKLTTIKPSDVDPNTPGKNSDMFETITRTITYIDPTTQKQVNDKQEIKYQRTKTTNEDDSKDISYGKWELMNGQTASWPDYEVKTFDGLYKISASGKDSKGNDVAIINKDGKKIIASDTPTVSDDLAKINNVNITLTYTRTEAGKFIDDNKNNAATQTILVHQTKTNDPSAIVATDGIKKSDDYKLADKDSVVWKDTTKLPDTSVVTPEGEIPTYAATVTFNDGSTIDVNIPIKIWNDASKFNENNNPDKDHKNVLSQEIDYNKGTVVKKGDSAIQGFDKDKYDITSVVYNEDVDTSKATTDTTPYDVDIKFSDGSEIKKGVTVPVKILDKGDASNFDNDNGEKNALVHELNYGKGYNNGVLAPEDAKDGIGKTSADNAKAIADYNIDKVVFNENVSTETAHPSQNESAIITFKDGTESIISIPVEITDEASENDKNIVIKTSPVQTDQGTAVEAANLIDTDKTKTPEGTKYEFGTKTADFNTPGTQDVTIIATYPDGTRGQEIAGKVTVEATPEIQTITLKQGVAAKATDANAGIKNLQASGVDGMPKSVVWTSDAPSTDKAGKESINVTITYNDGYKKSVNIPVNVLETIHGSKDTPKDPNGSKDLYREVTRNVSIDGEKQPTQTIIFTRDVYVDTQNGNKIIGYSDWVKNGNFTEVNIHKDGYASIVKLNGKDVSLTNETIPAEDKDITADSQNENYVVTHSANADTVTIKYVNASDKKTEVTDDTPGDSFNGTTGQKITMSKDQLTVPTGYKLNDTLNGDYTYTFGTDKNQTKIIYVDQLTTYHPDDEHIAPSGEDSDMFKDVTRKIIVKNPVTGKDDETDQVIHLARNKVINDTTGKVESYGKWTFKDDTKTWPEFDVPQFDSLYTITAVDNQGKTVDISSKKIDSKSFDPSDEKNIPADTTITISYTRTNAGKFTDDNKNNANVQAILVKQNTDPTTIDAKAGIKENKDYTITSVAFVDPTSIDTKTIGTKNYDALVTFGDKSTVKVSIPVKVWNDKSKFDEDNSKNPLTQEMDIKQSTPTPAGSSAKDGFSQEVWKAYDIKDAKFDKDIDTSKVTTASTPYDVTVTFNDGTTASVKVPVKIISGDATKFDHDNNDPANPDAKDLLAQVIRVKEGTDAKTINAETGIKNADQYDIRNVSFNDVNKIDTSGQAAGKKTSYTATIVFNDGTQSSINIPIYVYNDAVNYHDNHKDSTDPTKTIATNPIHENMGSQVPATDAAKSLTADEISKYGITASGDDAPKFNETIDTSKVDQTGKHYAATIHFADGSSLTDVQIKVLVDDKGNAAHFNNDNKDNALVKQLIWGKGTTHTASEAINGIKDPTAYNVTDAAFTTLPLTDEVHPAQAFQATVSFKDGTSLTVQIPVAVTDQAHDTTVETQPIHIPVDPGKTPEIPDPHNGIKNPDKLPDGTKVEWTDKTPNVPNPGKTPTTPEITITYPDGTKKTVDPEVDSIWAPVAGKLTTKLNETPDLTNNNTDKEAITNFGQGTGYPKTLTWVTKPNVSKAGLVNSTIHVAYDDGYEVDVTVPVNVLDIKKGSDVIKTPTDPDYKNMIKTITRTITVDGETPITQTVTFTRDKYTDTTKDTDNVTYGVWTTNNPTFEETTKVSKDGYTTTITGSNQKGTAYKLTANGTIAAETIEAPKADNTDWNPVNEIINITNKANEQKVTLNFVNAKDGKTIVGHQDLTGVTDQTLPIDSAKLTLPDGYKIDKNSGLPTSYKFKSSNNDPITVLVDHLTTIKPSDVDPKNPGKNSDMFETITRHFEINGVTSEQVTPIPDQAVSFQRTKTVNDEDPTDIVYGEWTPVNTSATSWGEVNVTKLDHYNLAATQDGKALDITSGKIVAVDVEPNGTNPTKNTSIVLTYSLDQSGQYQHDINHDALVNIIRVKKGTPSNEVTASDGISKQTEYHITGINWDKDVQIDTATTGIHPYNAVVSFEDGSSLKVKIPVKVCDRASDFIDDFNNNKITPIPVVEKMGIPSPRTDAIKGFDTATKTKYGIVTKDDKNTTEFTVDVPVNKVQETKVQAQVVFDDGSVATIDIPVDVKASQASDFMNNANAKVQTVDEIYNSSVDNHDAFTKGIVDAKRDNVKDANFVQHIDTTQKDTTINYRAKLEFNDGSTVDVMIPVKIVTEAENFDNANKDSSLIKGLEVKVGDVVNKEDAIKGLSEINPKNPIMDKAEFKNTVTTDQAGTNNYQATITFKDGSITEVTIPVTVGDDDASRFNPTTDLKPIEVHKGDKINPSDHDADSALKNVPAGTHAKFEDSSTIDTTVPGTTKHDITITFPDDSKKEHISVDVHVYTDSDKFDYTKNVKPITIHHGTTIDLSDSNNAKDAVVDPDGVIESVKFADPSEIDTSTVGKAENPQIIITFKDGSTSAGRIIKVPVTIVNSDADNFNSSNFKPITVSEGDKLPSDPMAQVIDPNGKNVVQVTYNENNDPDVTKTPGKKQIKVDVTFKDGSAKTVSIPVIVSDKGTPTKYESGKDMVNDEFNKYVTRTIEMISPVSNKVDYIIQTIHFAREDKDGNAAYTDPVSGKKTYVPWVVMDKDGKLTNKTNGVWKEITEDQFDKFDGYKPSVSDFAEVAVTPDAESKEDIVTYAIDFNAVSLLFANQKVDENQSATFTPVLINKKTGKRLNVPAGQLLYSFDPKNMQNLPNDAKVDEKTGQITVPAGQLAKLYNMSLIAKNTLGESKPLVATLDVTKPNNTDNTSGTSTDNTGSNNQNNSGANTPEIPNVPDTTPTTPVQPATPTQSDSDKYAPIGQDISTKPGSLPDATDGIKNKDQMPAGTTYTWKTDPNVDNTGSANGTIVVKFNDGSTKDVNVKIDVKNAESDNSAVSNKDSKQNETIKHTDPVIIHLTIKKGGKLPDPEDLVKNMDNLPEGTEVYWIKKPNVNKAGRQEGIIGIKYPDGKTTKKHFYLTVKPGNALGSEERDSSSAKPSHNGQTDYNNSSRLGNNSGYSTNKYNSTIATKGEFADLGSLGRTSSATSINSGVKSEKAMSSHATLPKTGSDENEAAQAAGLLALGLGMIGLAGVKKRKKRD